MGLRDVAAPAGLDGQGSTTPADRVDDPVMRDDAWHDVALVARGAPQFLARVRIEPGDATLHAQDKLLAFFGRRHQHGRPPGRADLGSLPHFLTAGLLQGDQGARLDAGVDDQEILVEDWGGTRAPAVGAFADQDMPELVAVEIETEDARLAEEDIQIFTIRNRRTGGVTVIGTFAGVAVFGQDRRKFLRPNHLPIAAIQAQEMPAEILLLAGFLRIHA